MGSDPTAVDRMSLGALSSMFRVFALQNGAGQGLKEDEMDALLQEIRAMNIPGVKV
jgi:hypothetical protein